MKKCLICKQKIVDGVEYERIHIRPLKSQSPRHLIIDDPWLGFRFEYYVCEECFCHLEGSRTSGKIPMYAEISD